MASPEGDKLPSGVFHPVVYKIEAYILQIAEKWKWN